MDFKIIIMKMKLIILATLFISLSSFSQGVNLEFNQVLTYDSAYTENLTGSGNWTRYSNELIVPENKVWKIQFMSPQRGLRVNNVEFDYAIFSGSGAYQGVSMPNSPIWLDSGDKLRFRFTGSWNGNGSNSINYSYFVSILEFNLN